MVIVRLKLLHGLMLFQAQKESRYVNCAAEAGIAIHNDPIPRPALV